ncbi:MAG: polysaccharide biosynthesis/export family protein [Sphingobacteriales bacterium]
MEKKLLPLYVLACAILLNSCNSYYKDVPYYQNLDHSRVSEEKINNYTPLRIQSGDILGITVTSLNENITNTNSEFNASSKNPAGQDVLADGYRVDPGGAVHLPYVGTMKVAGLTTDEMARDLSSGLESYFKKPIVNIRILNFKISVFGDVLRPDIYTVQNQHVNINEALALAGDLNISAKRKNVLLIRETGGKREYVPIDLTNKDVFDSPYYYLKNNDMIYVEPDKTKYDSIDPGYRTTTLAISAISAAASIIVSLLLLRKY